MDSLVNAIRDVLNFVINDDARVELLMKSLRYQVGEVLDMMVVYRTQAEDAWVVHCYILAINFYLGHF